MAEKCGGIWLKSKKDGERFLTIQIGDKNYVAWKNDKGDNPKRPDFTVYPSEPRESQPPAPRTAPPAAKPPVQIVKDIFEEEIPF